MKFFILLTLCLFATSSFAKSMGKITEVDLKNSTLIIKTSIADVKTGMTYNVENKSGSECLVVIKNKVGKSVVAEIMDCSSRKKIKVGHTVVTTAEVLSTSKKTDYLALDSGHLPTINESWYIVFGLGFAFDSSYSDSTMSNYFESQAKRTGTSRTTISFDIFGAYWARPGHKAMHGVVWHSAADTIVDNNDNSMSILHYNFAYSYYHFFGANIGNGWYLRGDAGLGFFINDFTTTYYNSVNKSSNGLGLLLGGGYAFRLGRATRMTVGLTHTRIDAEDTTSGISSLGVGFIF